jgi:glutathione synthase/RimK-type ligase-like ATP-grasp enzyme
MESRFLFFTGEPATTLPLLKQRPAWSPVLSALTFDVTAGRLHRRGSATDDFRGAVYFADVRDKDIERHNLRVLEDHAIPCWPDPAALLAASDRHAALGRCVAAGLIDHPVVQSHFTREALLPFPYVLKIGEEHRGEGKHLIRSASDIPRWEGLATMEPFFDGESVRVLLLGDRAFGVRIHNEGSWIKNSAGASFEAWEPGEAITTHARRAMRLFGLEIAGMDYVVDAAGFHFIELNPFPRVGLSKESAAVAREIFRGVMATIEARSSPGEGSGGIRAASC